MHIEVTRAVKPGKALTRAQRNSSLFAEEPRVAGKTLRRGSPPLRLNQEQFERSSTQIKRLFLAGAVDLALCDGPNRSDLRAELDKAVKAGASKEEMAEMMIAAFERDIPSGSRMRREPPVETAPPADDGMSSKELDKQVDEITKVIDEGHANDLENMKTPTEPIAQVEAAPATALKIEEELAPSTEPALPTEPAQEEAEASTTSEAPAAEQSTKKKSHKKEK